MGYGDFSTLRAVILAAGLSSRMGEELKALRPLGDTSMLGAALRAFAGAGVPGVRVVTGHRSAEVAQEALRHGGTPVHNPDFMQGMFTSVRAGLADIAAERPGPQGRSVFAAEGAANGPEVGAVFILPVDAALVKPESITAIALAWRALVPELRGRAILIPGFAGRCGHPPLLGAAHAAALLAMPPKERGSGRDQNGGGLRGYVRSLLSGEAEAAFNAGRLPQNAPLALIPPVLPSDRPAFEPLRPVVRQKQALSAQQRRGAVFFFSLPDIGVVSDMDTPEDLALADSLLKNTRGRRDPAPDEAWEYLRLSGLPAVKIGHSIKVALGALRLGLALHGAGLAFDPGLCVCGGLLHDIARERKRHALEGAKMVRREGWEDCAAVVQAHTVLPDSMLAALGLAARDLPLGEGDRPIGGPDATLRPEVLYASACVYLADKFWYGTEPVGIERRFAVVKDHFAGDEEALRAVCHREGIALAVAERLGALAGGDAETLARTPVAHPLEAWLADLPEVPEQEQELAGSCGGSS